eukprot:scaffold211800_cov41-Tisochrysis_lutea.AAC.3
MQRCFVVPPSGRAARYVREYSQLQHQEEAGSAYAMTHSATCNFARIGGGLCDAIINHVLPPVLPYAYAPLGVIFYVSCVVVNCCRDPHQFDFPSSFYTHAMCLIAKSDPYCTYLR